jgi:hypothetical protein
LACRSTITGTVMPSVGTASTMKQIVRQPSWQQLGLVRDIPGHEAGVMADHGRDRCARPPEVTFSSRPAARRSRKAR